MAHAKFEATRSWNDDNSSMPSFILHCIRFWLGVAPIFLLAGCWEKIEYTASKASPAPPGVLQEATNAAPINSSAEVATPASTEAKVNRTPQPVPSAPTPVPAAPRSDDRYAIATPASATMEVAPSKPSPNTRRAAWTLGSRLSLAA